MTENDATVWVYLVVRMRGTVGGGVLGECGGGDRCCGSKSDGDLIH